MAGVLAVVLSARGPRPGEGWLLWLLLGLACLVLLATAVAGVALGRWQLWALLRWSVASATLFTIAWYLAAMSTSPDPGSDDAAGVGAMFLTPIVALGYGAVAGLAALLAAPRRKQR